MNKLTGRFFLSIGLFTLVAMLASCADDSPTSSEAQNEVPERELTPYPVSQLDEELTWETNLDDPIFADPNAKKGGRYSTYINAFPLTLRVVGPDSNNSMRSLQLNNQMGLVGFHPNTDRVIPEMATHWAYGEDGRTVYYKLNPDARWSDGKPVTADDYLFTLEFMRSPHIVAPWYNNHYSEEIQDVKKYDDYTISVTGTRQKPKIDLHLYYSLRPIPRHFHVLKENWVQEYNWQIEPNTGAYQISKIEKGKFLEFKRKQDWWAKDLRYTQHRFNVDRIRIKVIRDEEIAFRHFMKGDLDSFSLQEPKFWHDKATGPLFDSGYIHKIWFYNDVPRSPFGLFLNQDNEIFADQNARYGFAHAMNIDRMIKQVLRGDYQRLPGYHVGYGDYSNTDIEPRNFDLDKANAYLDLAGWTTRNADGIRTKGGKPFSVSVVYGTALHNDKLVLLKEEAKKAGIDLRLELLDSASFYKKLNEKSYQIALLGFGVGYRPAFWQHFHSENAHKPQTNNMTNTDNPELDKRIMAYREATEEPVRQALARELGAMVHDIGAFVPAYYAPYTRRGYWRWVKLPEFHGTRKSGSPLEMFGSTGGLFWVNEADRQATLDARKDATVFESTTIINDTYKVD